MIDIKVIEEILNKHEERNLLLAEASRILGFDITFSNEEIMKYAEEEFVKYIENEMVGRLLHG